MGDEDEKINLDGDIAEHLEEDEEYVNEWKKALQLEFRTRVKEARNDSKLKKEAADRSSAPRSTTFFSKSPKNMNAELGEKYDEASAREYAIVVAKAIAQRLQLTCGLTTRMFKSYDDDEIFLVKSFQKNHTKRVDSPLPRLT